MSGVKNAIYLQDKVSSVLMRIEKQFKITEKAALGLDGAGGLGRLLPGIRKSTTETEGLNDKLGKTKQIADGVNGSFLKWGAGIAGAYIAIRGVASAMSGITDKVDDYTNMSARLNLINDGQQTTPELSNIVYAAAQRARGNYTEMGAAVGKMGMLASDAFSGNDEIVGFTELMQKSFKLGGSSKQEQSSGMYQLTQAMAAGKLQGDEFRSIMENAPMLAQAIAKYTGKSMGDLKKMSAEGLITANIIKGALFSAGDDIESQFKTLPITFGDMANIFFNKIKKGFEPVFARISQMINTERFQAFMDNVAGAFILLGNVAAGVIDVMATGVNFIAEHWGVVGPILLFTAGALGVLINAILIAKAAQWLLNGAMLVCPLTWIILGFMAIGAAIALVVKAINHFTGSSISGIGIVVGVFAISGAAIWNILASVLNIGLGVANGLWNRFAAFANFFANCFRDPAGSVISLFGGMGNSVFNIIKGVAKGVDTLLGTKTAGAIDKLQSKVTSWAQSKTTGEYKKIIPTADFSVPGFDLGGVWNKSYKWGSGLSGKLKDMVSGGALDYSGFDSANLGDKSVDTVNNVGTVDKINSEINIADESLKYLIDGVIRGNINNINLKTSQPNFKIDFNGDINNGQDADKIAEQIIEKAKEKLYSGTDLGYGF